MESRYIDIAADTYALDTTGSITHLDEVPRGYTVNTRNGAVFRSTGVVLRGHAVNGSTAVYNDCSVLIVWDKHPNQALASITDILDSVSSHSLNNRSKACRFVTIKRWDFTLVGKGDGTSGGDKFVTAFHYNLDLPKHCVACCTTSDATGEIGNRTSGALLMVTVGNNAAGNAAAELAVTMRVNFVDI